MFINCILFIFISISFFSQQVFAFEATQEDCIRLNIERLTVERSGRTGSFRVTDGKKDFFRTRLQMNAQRALVAIRNLEMSQECFIDREEETFQYFLTPHGKAPTGRASAIENCYDFSRDDFDIKEERRFFRTYYHLMVRPQGEQDYSIDLARFVNERDAKKAWQVIEKHHFDQVCFESDVRPEFRYFKATQ